MSFLVSHDKAMHLAQIASLSQDISLRQVEYTRAAAFEEEAWAQCPETLTRTWNILAISCLALRVKAGMVSQMALDHYMKLIRGNRLESWAEYEIAKMIEGMTRVTGNAAPKLDNISRNETPPETKVADSLATGDGTAAAEATE